MQTSEVQQFAKEYNEKLSDIMKDEQNVLALDNIEQSHIYLKIQTYGKNFIQVSPMRIYLRQMRTMTLKGEQYNQKPTPDTIGDTYLSAESAIPRHGYEYPQYARVIKRRKNQEGNPVDIANNNPILDTCEYIIDFMNGH